LRSFYVEAYAGHLNAKGWQRMGNVVDTRTDSQTSEAGATDVPSPRSTAEWWTAIKRQSASQGAAINGIVNDAPVQSFRWLRPLIPPRLQPILRNIRKRYQRRDLSLTEPFHSVYPFIQASASRQHNLLRLGQILDHDGVPGVIVECGVLDGGTSALMAYATVRSARAVHMFDSWQGLPKIHVQDGKGASKWAGQAVGSPMRVLECMESLDIDVSRLHFHIGWFHETFPKAVIASIALLHIDCGFYEPTKLCLETWYSKVSPGGFLQFDDYDSFIGCRRAVDEFLSSQGCLRIETFGQDGVAYFLRKPAAAL
jgi:O-methyltransferase